MNTCYIVGAGDFDCTFTPDKDDLIIAADGGYDALILHGIRPSLLVGDLDSLSSSAKDIEKIVFPKEKDETDTHLAYLEGVKRGFKKFKIYGGTGGRLDHTLANISLLLYAAERGHEMSLIDKQSSSIVIKNGKAHIKGDRGKQISVFAIGGEARGVNIEGLYYEAKDSILSPSFALGVSNHFIEGKEARISVSDGALLIMCER